MPITLRTADRGAEKWPWKNCTTSQELFQNSCRDDSRKSKQIIQSSFSHSLTEGHVTSNSNGFVNALYSAYSRHHHLTIRPEDVWFSILNQLSFYINAHAEELRSLFVAHEGQKQLTVTAAGTIHTVDLGRLAVTMTEEIEKNVIDPELRKWMLPDFTTTTESDTVVAAILMMGSMQKYFSYSMCLLCGLPSVTLLGEREDWEKLLERLAKIPTFGKEPAKFASLLEPVLKRFVASFDEPTSPALREFWNQCAHHLGGGSGPTYLSGWVTAFCFWDEEGKRLDDPGRGGNAVLDDVMFHIVDTDKIPRGYSSVPVKLDDNGVEYDTDMLAGMVGIHAGSEGLDTIQPVSGWWMYEKVSGEELKKLQDEEAEKYKF